MIDTATIKQAAIDSDETGFASVLTNNDTVIALCDEIESLRNGMYNIANQSTEPAIQDFAQSYLGEK